MRPWLAALALLAAACAHQTRDTHPPLERVLRLEIRLTDVTQRADTLFHVDFSLRNVGKVPVAFCQADSGVSVGVMRKRDAAMHAVVLHGLALNPLDRCNERTELAPGAAKAYREPVRVRADLAGPAQLFGYIRVHRPGPLRSEADIPTIRSRGAWITVLR